jgi:hypothetical protein
MKFNELYESTILRQMMSIPKDIKYMAVDKNGVKVVATLPLSSKSNLSKVSDHWIKAGEVINNKGDLVDKVYFYDVDGNKLMAVHTQDENPDLNNKVGITFKPEKSTKGAPYEVEDTNSNPK